MFEHIVYGHHVGARQSSRQPEQMGDVNQITAQMSENVAECRRIGDRIPPFRPFGWGERQRVIQHGVEHVNEWHFGDHAGIEIGQKIATEDAEDRGKEVEHADENQLRLAAIAARPVDHTHLRPRPRMARRRPHHWNARWNA